MKIQAQAKFLLSLLSSAIVALIVAIVLAAISISGVQSMTAANVFLWIGFSIFAIAELAAAVIYCPNASGTKSAFIMVLLIAAFAGGYFGRAELSTWLNREKTLQLTVEAIQVPHVYQPPVAPKFAPATPAEKAKTTINTKQNGNTTATITQTVNGNASSPGTVAGSINSGPCSVVQVGGSDNKAVGGTCGPPPLVLDVVSVKSGSEGTDFVERPGFVKTEITIVPNQQVTAPFNIALEFDNPIEDIGHTVKNVGAMMGGGPFRRGIHARETVSTSIGPSHPLVIVVFSLLPVKLVAPPRIEY